jgi:ubiquinone/menaquinone biosynthesis C-methylase UbiE
VYANDIQQGMLDIIRGRLDKARISNVKLVLGESADPKLPPSSIDMALMVDVYHEVQEPQAMLRRVRDALKPEGRLVLLEYRKEDPTIPINPSHKMSVEEARLEVEHEGFELTVVNEDLPRQHILIFKKR